MRKGHASSRRRRRRRPCARPPAARAHAPVRARLTNCQGRRLLRAVDRQPRTRLPRAFPSTTTPNRQFHDPRRHPPRACLRPSARCPGFPKGGAHERLPRFSDLPGRRGARPGLRGTQGRVSARVDGRRRHGRLCVSNKGGAAGQGQGLTEVEQPAAETTARDRGPEHRDATTTALLVHGEDPGLAGYPPRQATPRTLHRTKGSSAIAELELSDCFDRSEDRLSP